MFLHWLVQELVLATAGSYGENVVSVHSRILMRRKTYHLVVYQETDVSLYITRSSSLHYLFDVPP